MNNKKSIGILLEEGGGFDRQMLGMARLFIEEAAEKLHASGRVTRQRLASELGVERNRIVRLTKALGITSVFGDA